MSQTSKSAAPDGQGGYGALANGVAHHGAGGFAARSPMVSRAPGNAPDRQAPMEPNNRAPTSDDAAVGRRIKVERRAAGRTQKDLAHTIGVTGAQFHRYEAGTTRVAASRLMAIAATLHLRPEALMGMSVPPPAAVHPVMYSELHPVPHPTPAGGGHGVDDLVELVEVFATITDPRRRHALLAFARVIASGQQSTAAEPPAE